MLGNHVGFEGRAARAEYWWWQLALVILALLVGGVTYGHDPFAQPLGVLILVWWSLQPGTPGPNRFGPDPRGG